MYLVQSSSFYKGRGGQDEPHHSANDASYESTADTSDEAKDGVPAKSRESKLAHEAV
jgi:hypothetical protein